VFLSRRTLRSAAAITAAIVVLAVADPSAASGACGGGKTVDSNAYGRVWMTRLHRINHFHACLWRVGLRVSLDAAIPKDLQFLDERSLTVTIGRRYVGYAISLASSDSGVEESDAVVAATSLRTGRNKHRVVIGGGRGNQNYDSVSELVMRDNGSLAWITDYSYFDSLDGAEGSYEILRRIDHRGYATLDSSRGLANLLLLELNGSRLTWDHGKALRRSTLL
jgi:hypothetical protein